MAESSRQLKEQIMRKIQQETAKGNAQALIDSIQDNCFEKCVPKPGASLSKTESTCFGQCVDKYVAAWNQVNSSLIRTISEERNR